MVHVDRVWSIAMTECHKVLSDSKKRRKELNWKTRKRRLVWIEMGSLGFTVLIVFVFFSQYLVTSKVYTYFALNISLYLGLLSFQKKFILNRVSRGVGRLWPSGAPAKEDARPPKMLLGIQLYPQALKIFDISVLCLLLELIFLNSEPLDSNFTAAS